MPGERDSQAELDCGERSEGVHAALETRLDGLLPLMRHDPEQNQTDSHHHKRDKQTQRAPGSLAYSL